MKKPIGIKSGLILPLTLIALTLAALVAINNNAHAAGRITRANCFARGSAGEMGRTMGVRNGSRIVQALWQRLGRTCNNVDRLAQIISETPLARPMRGGEFAACFYLGYTDALWEQIDTVYENCGQRCFNAGTEIGNISAQGYCAASVAVGGLYDPGFIAQPPLPFCGANLVMGCKAEYVAVAQWEFPGCTPFTEGYFAETFDNSVRQDCFVPSDIPIRDHELDRNSSRIEDLYDLG